MCVVCNRPTNKSSVQIKSLEEFCTAFKQNESSGWQWKLTEALLVFPPKVPISGNEINCCISFCLYLELLVCEFWSRVQDWRTKKAAIINRHERVG